MLLANMTSPDSMLCRPDFLVIIPMASLEHTAAFARVYRT